MKDIFAAVTSNTGVLVFGGVLLIIGVVLMLVGCAKDFCPKVPKPLPPVTRKVVIEEGTIKRHNLENAIFNMLELQQYIDELELCPCYGE